MTMCTGYTTVKMIGVSISPIATIIDATPTVNEAMLIQNVYMCLPSFEKKMDYYVITALRTHNVLIISVIPSVIAA